MLGRNLPTSKFHEVRKRDKMASFEDVPLDEPETPRYLDPSPTASSRPTDYTWMPSWPSNEATKDIPLIEMNITQPVKAESIPSPSSGILVEQEQALSIDDAPNDPEYEFAEQADISQSSDESIYLSDSEQPKVVPVKGSGDWNMIVPGNQSMESAVEHVLLLCLYPAINGTPSLRIYSATDRASDLLRKTSGDIEKAVRLAADDELSPGRLRLLLDFLLRQIPFVGLPVSFLSQTLSNLRSAATVAALYGHDLQQPRTQHELLWCLVPSSSGGAADTTTEAARAVAQALVGAVVARATGLGFASDLVNLGGSLIQTSADDGFNLVDADSSPVGNARRIFSPAVSGPVQLVQLALLILGIILPTLAGLQVKIIGITISAVAVAAIVLWKFKVPIPPRAQIIAFAIFSVHAILPVLGFTGALRQFFSACGEQSWARRISLAALGVVGLSAGLLRGKEQWERRLRMARVGVATLVIPQLLFPGEDESVLWSAWFLSAALSSICQWQLLELLKKREVFLRLIGAERVSVLSLALIFRGVSSVVSDDLAGFLNLVSPHPYVVCILHCVRFYASWLSAVIVVMPAVAATVLPAWLAVWAGSFVGAGLVGVLIRDWHLSQASYGSTLRVLILLPGDLDDRMHSLLAQTGSKFSRFFALGLLRGLLARLIARFRG